MLLRPFQNFKLEHVLLCQFCRECQLATHRHPACTEWWLGLGGHKGLLAQQNLLNNAQDHLIASQLWTNGMVKWLSLSGFSLVAEVLTSCALCLRVASKVANARLENSSTQASRGSPIALLSDVILTSSIIPYGSLRHSTILKLYSSTFHKNH